MAMSRSVPLLTAAIVAVAALMAAFSGTASGADIWVDPARGNNAWSGSETRPLATVTAAWNRLPQTSTEQTTIHLRAGDYRGRTPNYWEDKGGSASARVIFRSADGRGRARLPGVNLFQVRYLEFRGISFTDGGDVVHCERCQNFVLRNVNVTGREAQETIKVNQSTGISILGSRVKGAGDNSIDFVAVGRGRIRNNVVSDAGDWCAYAKGGSWDIVVSGNLFTRCGTGGFSAGQGTGFQFMESPWLQYEAVGVVVRDNTVTETEGAAFGIQGGFNVLVADNVARRVGRRSHLLEAVFGLRSCDGRPGDEGRERCQAYLDEGGWGTTVVDDGSNSVRIGNRHAYFSGNVILNPMPYESQWQQLEVFGGYGAQPGTNVPADTAGDSDLRFLRNVIWNGDSGKPLGIPSQSGGCRTENPTCNPNLVREGNRINARRPSLEAGTGGRLQVTGWAATYRAQASPPQPDWTDLPAGSAPWTTWPR